MNFVFTKLNVLKRLGIVAILFLWVVCAFPAPYVGDIVYTYYQPDGASFSVKLYGDEFFAYQQTLDGYVIIKDPSTGFYCYAQLTADASELISTGIPVVTTLQSYAEQKTKALGLVEPEIRLSQGALTEIISVQRQIYNIDLSAEVREFQLKTESSTPVSVPEREVISGNYKGLTILVDFPDQAATISPSEVELFFNKSGYKKFYNACSVRDYFLMQSDSLVDYTNEVTAYVRMPKPKTYYDDGSANTIGTSKTYELITTALQLLVNEGFDFTPFTTEEMGSRHYIKALNVLYTGTCTSGWNTGLWPHKWSIPSMQVDSVNNIWIYAYQLSDLKDELSIGTVCHETGHLLFNFPDLYSYNDSKIRLGNFSLMSQGGAAAYGKHPTNIDPYLRIQAGWCDPIDISRLPDTLTFTHTGREVYRYRNPSDSTEAFLIEFRNNGYLEGPWGGSNRSVNPTSGICLYHALDRGSNTFSTIKNTTNVDYSIPYKLLLLESTPDLYSPLWFLQPSPTASDGWKTNSGPDIIHSGSHPSLNFWSSTGRNIEALINLSNVTDYNSLSMSCVVDGLGFDIAASASVGGKISPPGTVTIAYRNDFSFQIVPDTGYYISDVLVDGVSVGTKSGYTFYQVVDNHSIHAVFEPTTFSIVVNTPNGGGTVLPSGSVPVPFNDTLGFSIVADVGYQIDSVVLDGVNLGVIDTLSLFSVKSDHVIEAFFSIQRFMVTTSIIDNSGGLLTDTAYYSFHQQATYSFTSKEGFTLDSVIINNVNFGSTDEFTIHEIETDYEIRTYYSRLVYSIIVDADFGASIEPNDSITSYYNDSLRIVIHTDEGYRIDSIWLDSIQQPVNDTVILSHIEADHHLHIFVSPIVYQITTAATTGGTIDPSGISYIPYHGEQIFRITPLIGYQADSVMVDGFRHIPIDSVVFTQVDSNHEIEAFFSPVQFTIHASATLGGEVIPVGSSVYFYGDDKEFLISTDLGFQLDSVWVDSVNFGKINSFVFENISDDHSIRAFFSVIEIEMVSAHSIGGIITPYGNTQVAFGDTLVYTILPDEGYQLDSVLIDGFNSGSLPNYSFEHITKTHSIEAYFSVIRHTVVASAGIGGTIQPGGELFFQSGVHQNFVIEAFDGYHILDVLVDNQSVGPMDTVKLFDIAGNHQINAIFIPDSVTITVIRTDGGFIEPGGEHKIAYSDTVRYFVQPDVGFHIKDVIVNNTSLGAITNYLFTGARGNQTIEAIFTPDSFNIESLAAEGGAILPEGITTIAYNDGLQYQFIPSEGYHLIDVLVDGISVGNPSGYSFNNVSSNHQIQAVFAIDTFSISVINSGGGSINPVADTAITYGQNLLFQFVPDFGFSVGQVLIDGFEKGQLTFFEFTDVKEDHVVEVLFVPDTFTISALAGEGGTVQPSGLVPITFNEDLQFVFTANLGYSVAEVWVNDHRVDSISRYTFQNISSDNAINVLFTPDTFYIDAIASAGGKIVPTGNTMGFYGDTIQFDFLPDTGYHIHEVLIDGSTIGVTNFYSFNGLLANHQLQVKFVPDTFIISASASAGGTISPEGELSVSFGECVHFDLIPDEGHSVAKMLIDGLSIQSQTLTYSFSNVANNHTIEAFFVPDTFEIKTIAGKGGKVNPEGVNKVVFGTDITISIIPETGYEIDELLVDGLPVTTVHQYKFTHINAHHTIQATFKLKTYTITAKADQGGSISPDGIRLVQHGETVTYSILPDEAYAIADILVDGKSQGTSKNFTFTKVSANHSIRAIFIKKFFTVTITASEGGNVEPSGVITVEGGKSKPIVITPDSAFFVSTIYVNDEKVGDSTELLLDNILGNIRVHVEFSKYTGISATHVMPLAVYPNPSNGTFTLEWPGELDAGSVLRIISIEGKLLRLIPLQAGQQLLYVNDLIPGYYILLLVSDELIYKSEVLILPNL